MKTLLFSLLLVVFSFSISNAQNHSGNRNIDSNDIFFYKKWKKWYTPENAMFETQYPILENIPPLTTGMPYDIMLFYVYADSLSQNYFQIDSSYQDYVWNRWDKKNDTLTSALKYTYKAIDYNPIIYQQYIEETARYKKIFGHIKITNVSGKIYELNEDNQSPFNRYDLNCAAIDMKLKEKLYLSVTDTLKRDAYEAIYDTKYILRVRVTKIDSVLNSRDYDEYHRYVAYAEVLDTIKGKVFATELMAAPTSENSVEHQHLIKFQFLPQTYQTGVILAGGDVIYPPFKPDPAFKNHDGTFMLQAGQEAIVFLGFTNYSFDNEYDYFDLDITRDSNGALPIINGQVRDVNKIWSDQELLDYHQWKTIYNTLKNKIFDGSY